jgi:hypothetical protein
MLVEIQYRTKVQHAWSTAVELAGLVTENNPKFDRGSDDFIEYFRLVSEILARVFEGSNSCYPDMTTGDLLESYYELEFKTHMLELFSQLKRSDGGIDPTRSAILIFYYPTAENDFQDRLEVRSLESVNAAIQEYNRLEQELVDVADIVLVGSRSGEAIKSAYRNYFSDADEFIELVREGVGYLETELVIPRDDDEVIHS